MIEFRTNCLCDKCGESLGRKIPIISRNSMRYRISRSRLCDDCLDHIHDDGFSVCMYCGESIEGEATICPTCMATYHSCRVCHKKVDLTFAVFLKYHRDKKNATLRAGNLTKYICKECMESGHYVACNCGTIFQPSRLGEYQCKNCNADKFVEKPHIMTHRPFGGGNVYHLKSWRPFALELECVNKYNYINIPHVEGLSTHSDGSLQGICNGANVKSTIEFAIGPMQGDYGLGQVSKIIKLIRDSGWRCNSSCGLHMHIDISDILAHPDSGLIIDNINSFFTYYQLNLFSITNPKRLYNRYCRPNSKEIDMENRYQALNIAETNQFGTMEYRLFGGVTMHLRVTELVKILTSFTEYMIRNCNKKIEKGQGATLAKICSMSERQIKYWNGIVDIQKKKAEELGYNSNLILKVTDAPRQYFNCRFNGGC